MISMIEALVLYVHSKFQTYLICERYNYYHLLSKSGNIPDLAYLKEQQTHKYNVAGLCIVPLAVRFPKTNFDN